MLSVSDARNRAEDSEFAEALCLRCDLIRDRSMELGYLPFDLSQKCFRLAFEQRDILMCSSAFQPDALGHQGSCRV